MSVRRMIALMLLGIAPLNAFAQSAPLAPAARRTVVDSLARSLSDEYVFPTLGKQMAGELRRRLSSGAYDSLSAESLARQLNRDLDALAHDGHLRVSYFGPEPAKPEGNTPALDDWATWLRSINYGFERVEVLPGNIGLLVIRGFLLPEEARDAALAAMNKLSGVDALIVDLRRNGGGEATTVALVSSFLFPKGKKVHLNDLHWREGNRVEQFFTDPDLDAPRFSGPVYVLTSERTFSAAEEFTYNLKQLKRATQVGETTGGGANPGHGLLLGSGYEVFVPTGQAVNPISHDNWEGKGVVPEVPTPADSALVVATRLAKAAINRARS